MTARIYAATVLAGAAVLSGAVSHMGPAGKAWWAHIEILADDKMEGRKAGTEGHRKAAEYVASEFAKAKLQPAGADGYIQPVPFLVRKIVEPKSSLEIVRDGKAEPVEFGREASLMPMGQSDKTVEADAVFVGHGLLVPEKNVDDLKGLDLKGKIAVVIRGAPRSLPGPLMAHAASSAEQWRNFRKAGVIGVASIYNTNVSEIPWTRSVLARLNPTLRLNVPELVDNADQQVLIGISPTAADRFLAGTGHTAAELLALDKADKELPKFPLKVRIRAKASFTQNEAISQNVLGVMPGSDPKLKDEYVIYSAHLDHLGVGQPVSSDPQDRIYNGAMDNASGIATMIEVAKSLQGKQLKRSVLFAAVTGEEGGLLGSKYFANRPTVPAERIVADINTDMFMPIIPLKAITVLGLDESDLGKEFSKVAGKFGLPVKPDPEPQHNRFIRSDQYSFIRRGIPALAFKFHSDPGTPEQKIMDKWLHERYHSPSDDLSQPVNIQGAVLFNKVMAAFVEDVGNRSTRPEWYEGSFFRRYAAR